MPDEVSFVARGVDYSWGRPNPLALRQAGYAFAMRYLSWDMRTMGTPHTKNLTLGEAESLSAWGLRVGVVWETRAADPKGTVMLPGQDPYAIGSAHAVAAQYQAAKVGAPAGMPIYFAIDWDLSEAEVETVMTPYLLGVGREMSRYRIGVYGGYRAVDLAVSTGLASLGWQTKSWSGGKWSDRASIRQIQHQVMFEGLGRKDAIDINELHEDPHAAGLWVCGASE